MLTKLRTLASLYRELGLRWSAFRLAYAFRLRTGLIRLQMPQGKWDDYKKHVGAMSSRPVLPIPEKYPPTFPRNLELTEADAYFLIDGMPRFFFSRQLVHTGFPPDWHKDFFFEYVSFPPVQVSPNKHWSQISDDGNGDIKFIWEINRFSFVYALVRAYFATYNKEYPEAFWTLIEDWAEHNPPNTGPNWMDGQEIALRLMAWTFGFSHFSNSPSTTPERVSKFTLYVAAQAERIYKNIGYAISTRSNHTISEAFGLWLVGLFFPELKDTEKYLSLGRELLEQEAARQIFPDGSYSMYSLNYHRFILHIYLYAIRLGELNNVPFSESLKQRVESSIEYLSHLIDPQTGQMPVYGSNDGALVLPLNNCDFTDYRPLLQLGWYITKKEFLFKPGEWDEDVFWLCGESDLTPNPSPKGRGGLPSPHGRRVGEGVKTSFPDGGVYLLRGSNSKALIRCTDFRSRPSHADQLHVDLWFHGQNIACDAGTYLYSGEGMWRNGLARTNVHNTVTVDGKDQMTMVSRFTWTNWAKGKMLRHEENLWQGEHDGYKPVTHKRTVMALEEDRWLVIDRLVANVPHHYALHWLLNDFPFEQSDNSVVLSLTGTKYKVQVGLAGGNGKISVIRADANSTRGWRSQYYGHKEPAISVMLETTQSQAAFWTFFGFEQDQAALHDQTLKIGSAEMDLSNFL